MMAKAALKDSIKQAANILRQAGRMVLRHLPLRHRYIFTRHNKVRLRYWAVPATLVLAMTLSFAASYVPKAVSAVSNVQNVYAAQEDSDNPSVRYSFLQKRLNRYKRNGGFVDDAVQDFVNAVKGPEPKHKQIEIGKGDTLAGVLQKSGMSGSDAYRAVQAIEKHYDPRKIRPGQKISVRFDPLDMKAEDSDYQFAALNMIVDPLRTVSLERDAEGVFQADMQEKETVRKDYANTALIEISLYGSASRAGIPAAVIAKAIRTFSWDVDFQRDIRQGDILDVMYDQLETKDGTVVKSGELIYARLNVNGQEIPVYRYELSDGSIDYFTPNGKSIRKTLMSTPVDGARLSSGFGMRKHPVLGYNKMHKGVDFAAPTGTPIYAAGDGTIEKRGRWGAYGNYMRIRHNSSIKTAYAHLSRFAKGLSVGSRVKQGQVIGYVGATGRVTGAHLHYEVLQGGRQVNPKSVKMAEGETLKGKKLTAFKDHVKDIDRRYTELINGQAKYASLFGGR